MRGRILRSDNLKHLEIQADGNEQVIIKSVHGCQSFSSEKCLGNSMLSLSGAHIR